MREILTRISQRGRGHIDIKIFGDKVLVDEGNSYPLLTLLPLTATIILDVAKWPRCDVLIAFYSSDFPLQKAVSYVNLRKPTCVNDAEMQELLFDRRIVGLMLDHLKVPTPRRLEVSRDGGPKVGENLRAAVLEKHGIDVAPPRPIPIVSLREDGDAIIVDGKVMEKPFVEKPVAGEDHNVYIYFRGGGGRKLFRKASPYPLLVDPPSFANRTPDREQVQ